jgi:KDO2-lipid IV(A) lauroyltransferase
VTAVSDAIAFVMWALDGRGRNAARQNLAAVFGTEMSPRERRRVTRGSYRTAVRSIVLMFHLQPLTPARYATFVRITPEDDARFAALMAAHPKIVLVSGHFGNWELLLAARSILSYAPPFAYLAESTGSPAVDALLDRLRDRGSGGGALRKRGAMALKKALEVGRSVSLLVDRNVRGNLGGQYVPFLGIPARTTPLSAKLARWHDVPLAVALMLPEGPNRWRLWISGNLAADRTDDEETDVAATVARVNDVLSRAIREHPDAWCWMLKRWKSRPTPELGPYPPYSLLDPA